MPIGSSGLAFNMPCPSFLWAIYSLLFIGPKPVVACGVVEDFIVEINFDKYVRGTSRPREVGFKGLMLLSRNPAFRNWTMPCIHTTAAAATGPTASAGAPAACT
ncbi:hypothetical protein BD779DRAFT_1474554 [Infundibulicybe gibba]|nr:hypothetical protein BD779DRAFT_1474554 [Infundibulicybe gibba]